MQRGAMITLAGLRVADTVTGALDAGQARVDFLGAQTGEASAAPPRFRFGRRGSAVACLDVHRRAQPAGREEQRRDLVGAKITRSAATTLTTAP